MKNYYQHFIIFFIEESAIQNFNAIKELKKIFQNSNQYFTFINIILIL